MTITRFHIKYFDINKICLSQSPISAIIIGKRLTGKNILEKDLVYRIKHKICGGFVVTPERYSRHNVKPNIFVVDNYSSHYRQQNKLSGNHPDEFFIIFNECYNTVFHKDLLQTFANDKTNLITILQYWEASIHTPIPPRQNNFIFLLRNTLIHEREQIYRSFASTICSFNAFDTILTACTSKYECLVIDNTNTSNNVEDRFFWYKATMINDDWSFKLFDIKNYDSEQRIQTRNSLLKSDIMETYARKTMNPINLQPLLDNPDIQVDDFMTAYLDGL